MHFSWTCSPKKGQSKIPFARDRESYPDDTSGRYCHLNSRANRIADCAPQADFDSEAMRNQLRFTAGHRFSLFFQRTRQACFQGCISIRIGLSRSGFLVVCFETRPEPDEATEICHVEHAQSEMRSKTDELGLRSLEEKVYR